MRFRSTEYLGLEENPKFQSDVDGWLQTALESAPQGWPGLFSQLPGVFPSEVIAGLRRLGKTKLPILIQMAEEQHSLRCSRSPSKMLRNSDFQLEHPVDSEWHFTRAANEFLLSECKLWLERHYPTVLCIGCPTLFKFISTRQSMFDCVLWDKNSRTTDNISSVQTTNIDISCDKLPLIQAGVAVLDPPWYNEFYKLFIWAALVSLPIGGKIIFSFPPVGTRPSAKSDFFEIVKWAESAGARLVDRKFGVLPYKSPLFERNALRAAWIRGIPSDWRKADMVIMEKASEHILERPSSPSISKKWEEVQLGFVRVRINVKDTDAANEVMLKPVAQTLILPSVSSRYPGRQAANVVTSGNRFFFTSAPQRLLHYCQEIQVTPPYDRHVITKGLYLPRLNRIINLEQSEAIIHLSENHDQ